MVDSTLSKIFNPRSVALIGASDKEGTVGYIMMKNLTELGYGGRVYPVNIRKEEILGIKTFKTVKDVPEQVDLAIIATPAKTVAAVLEQCGEAGIKGVIIISAGFKEIGSEGRALEDEIRSVREKYDMRIIGPNCLGVIRPKAKLNATFTGRLPKAGSIAFISQSGALGTAILDLAIQKEIGLSNFVSLGSMIDVDFGDLIDHFGADKETESVLMYIEGITDAKRFMSAARQFARTKPIIVAKAGKYKESAMAAASHTGALTGEDMVYDAAFKRAGVMRVHEIADLFNAAEALGMQPLPKGPRIAIITNAGGPGVLVTDTVIATKGVLARLSQETVEKLNQVLPHYWSHGNPVDILGDAKADRYRATIDACLDDENIDGLIIIYTAQAVGNPVEIAEAIVEVCREKRCGKTVLTSFMGSQGVEEAVQILARNRFPTYSTPEQAVKTYMYMCQYKRNIELLYETPEDLPSDLASPKHSLMALIRSAADEGREILTEEESKIVLVNCRLPIVETRVARTPDEAAQTAAKLGYPVVLKVLSPTITHKTDAGGVELDITGEEALRAAFNRIMSAARKYDPSAVVEGVTVQRMIKRRGYEVIIGAKNDPIFGPVILFGMGGVGVEIFKDVAVGIPPLNRTLARRIMEETKVYRLLKGYRNNPPANIELLEEILVRFSQMLIDFPQFKEVDINPLFIDQKNAYALDARIVIDRETAYTTFKPKEQLVIAPYPQQYEDMYKLKNGLPVLLRPVKPEDEPRWVKMVQILSDESKRHRFFQTGEEEVDAQATRCCNIDYDREIAIIAETAEAQQRTILGDARLVTRPHEKTVEIALVVQDKWQRQGLGTKLLQTLIHISRDKGLHSIHGTMLEDNHKAVKLLEKQGFTIKPAENHTLKATLNL